VALLIQSMTVLHVVKPFVFKVWFVLNILAQMVKHLVAWLIKVCAVDLIHTSLRSMFRATCHHVQDLLGFHIPNLIVPMNQ
jgi:hypothetical protein